MEKTTKRNELMEYIIEKTKLFEAGMKCYENEKCCLPAGFAKHEKGIRDLQVFEDDVWVTTYPKCGTTWAQEMVWLLANDLDYEAAEQTKLTVRFPFLQFSAFEFDPELSKVDTVRIVETMQRPRFIKSHLPLSLLPAQLLDRKPKIVFVLRDPKDTAVSFYYHHCLFHAYEGTMDKFFEAFMEGSVFYGCYWHYVAPFWNLRHKPNVLVLTYEDMKKDLPSVLRRTASFFDKTVTDEQVAKLVDHLSFANMKDNDSVNFKAVVDEFQRIHQKPPPDGVVFIRNGKTGDYKNKMSPEMVMKFDTWSRNMKQALGISNDFPY